MKNERQVALIFFVQEESTRNPFRDGGHRGSERIEDGWSEGHM